MKRMAYSLSNRKYGVISYAAAALKVLTASARHYHQWLGLNPDRFYPWEKVTTLADKGFAPYYMKPCIPKRVGPRHPR